MSKKGSVVSVKQTACCVSTFCCAYLCRKEEGGERERGRRGSEGGLRFSLNVRCSMMVWAKETRQKETSKSLKKKKKTHAGSETEENRVLQ
jgi:hypothetical protein